MWFGLRLLPCAVALLALSCGLVGQDVEVRQRAVHLLEHADNISMVKEFGSYEQTIRFRSFSAAGVKEGLFTSVVRTPRSYRDEYQFGDFHLLVVVNGTMIADVGDRARAPFEVREITRLNHPYQARFDQTDVIRSIQESTVNARPSKCIEFDTIAGEKTEASEICIDNEYGVVVRARANGETVTFSDFFPYRAAYVPAHISYEQNDLRMELEQTKGATEGPFDPDFLTPPPNARVGHVCTAYRRPYGQFMPQPKPGNGNQQADVMLHGTIRQDGGIREVGIDRSERTDLNDEAMRIFNTWKFSAPLCDGKPIEVFTDVTLHFQGR
jgi:hypothetical protein